MLVLLVGFAAMTYLYNRATRAEIERQQELARSYVRQSELAMQRGQWGDAEGALKKAVADRGMVHRVRRSVGGRLPT